jgi:hypothetical protein
MHPTPTHEHLLEYQDYVLAYRLRALAGGRLAPAGPPLSLSDYARRRLERQALARDLLAAKPYHAALRRVEELTDALNFGFWHNPSETVAFLRQLGRQGGCRALESPEAFLEALLEPRERAALGDAGPLVARYYLGLLRASASYLDAEAFTRLTGELEPLRSQLPLVVTRLS